MTEAHWAFSVRDRHGRRRRGRVVYSDRVDVAAAGPGGSAEFLILIADAPADVEVAAATAVCVPKPQNVHAIRDLEATKLPSRLQDLTFRPHRMAAYAEGRIVAGPGVGIDPTDVFPGHSEHPRLDRLALALLAASDADAMAPYNALIRHELGPRPGTDALAALTERLLPANPGQQPPPRAPAVRRLAKAVRRMRDGIPPEATLEQMTEDLQFLRLFDAGDTPWPRVALDRLLGDVQGAAGRAPRSAAHDAPKDNIVPLHRAAKGDTPPEDA